MITKAIVIVLSMTTTFFVDSTSTPTYIPVDIEFCDYNSGKDDNICTIHEAENPSKNKIYLDNKGQNPKMLIDKRDINPDKANYIFRNNKITIGKDNRINLPYAKLNILIRAGEYDYTETRQGYLISL